jgi:hypothetical protein
LGFFFRLQSVCEKEPRPLTAGPMRFQQPPLAPEMQVLGVADSSALSRLDSPRLRWRELLGDLPAGVVLLAQGFTLSRADCGKSDLRGMRPRETIAQTRNPGVRKHWPLTTVLFPQASSGERPQPGPFRMYCHLRHVLSAPPRKPRVFKSFHSRPPEISQVERGA